MVEVVSKIELLAQVPKPVLFTGQTGAGKEQLAKLMHRLSPLSDGPFVAVDCRKLAPTEVLVSLFGDDLGHYPSDQNKREGLVDAAVDGVLYLNSVEALSQDAQAELARLLASGFHRRQNGEHDLRCRAWIIAASDQDLVGLVREGRLRKDLFYLLQIRTIEVPPLAERAEDLLPLAHQIVEELCLEQSRPIVSLEAEAICQIREHTWPGNVREMRRVLRESLQGGDSQLRQLKISGTQRRPADSEGLADRAWAVARRLREEAETHGLDLGGLAGQALSGVTSRLVSGARTLLRATAERLRRG
jgi:DNA-binding NtrC family response regulator